MALWNVRLIRTTLLYVAMSVLHLLSIEAALGWVHYAGVFFNRSLGCYTTGWSYTADLKYFEHYPEWWQSDG